MTRFLSRILSPLRRFRGDSHGSASLELVIVLPILLWALAATVVAFDGYKTRYRAQMAAQSIADIMSRETDAFTTGYVEGLNDVFDFLAEARVPTRIRVSAVSWDRENERPRVLWSYGARGLPALPEDTFVMMAGGDSAGLEAEFAGSGTGFNFNSGALQRPVGDLIDRIPVILPGEALILVEAFALWAPFTDVGIAQVRLSPVVAVRPRFSPWVNFEGIDTVYFDPDEETTWTDADNTGVPSPDDGEETTGGSHSVSYDFTNGTGGPNSGWSSSDVSSGGPDGNFLGRFGHTFYSPVTLTQTLPEAGMNATVSFDLIIIDSWDGLTTHPNYNQNGDVFELRVNGTPVAWAPFNYQQTSNYSLYGNTRSSAVYLNGATYRTTMVRTRAPDRSFVGSYWADQVWRVTLNIENAPVNLVLGFAASLDSGLSDESFGLDNVQITATSGSGTATPFTVDSSTYRKLDPQTQYPRYSGCPEPRILAPWLTASYSDLASPPTMRREIGGYTRLSSCPDIGGVGYSNAQPYLVLDYDNEGIDSSRRGLLITMDDSNSGRSCDSVLLIQDPHGQWWHNDDYSGYNAGLRIPNPASGQYVIFLGTYSATECTADLTISRF